MKKYSLLAPEIRALMDSPEFAQTMRETFSELHSYEVSSSLEGLKPGEIAQILLAIGLPKNVAIFEEFDDEDRRDILMCLSEKDRAKFIEEMSHDERIDLLKILPEDVRLGIYRLIAQAERNDILKLIDYEEGSVGAIVTTEYVSLAKNVQVQEALKQLRLVAPDKETIYYLYVVDDQHQLIGAVSLRELIIASDHQKIEDVMNRDVVRVNVNDDQESVSKVMSDYDLIAVPAVDRTGKLIGIVTVDDVMDVMVEEETEDILNLAAAGKHVDYFSTSTWCVARQRATWLLVLIFVGFASGYVLERYQSTLDAVVALVFFIPLLCASGGNAGTQSATVVIREMATDGICIGDLKRVLFKEFSVGALMGVLLGLISAIRAYFIDADPRLGLIVGVSMTVVIVFATSLGALLPIMLKKSKMDPALMSAPLIASIVDVCCIILYMEVSRLVFHLS